MRRNFIPAPQCRRLEGDCGHGTAKDLVRRADAHPIPDGLKFAVRPISTVRKRTSAWISEPVPVQSGDCLTQGDCI